MSSPLTYTVDACRAAPETSIGWTRQAEIRFDTGGDLADDLFGPADLLGTLLHACEVSGEIVVEPPVARDRRSDEQTSEATSCAR